MANVSKITRSKKTAKKVGAKPRTGGAKKTAARKATSTKHLTQRALRRTFNDLARAAQVNDLVTRSISSHLTEQMQRHYSTVNPTEQREALAKVIRLFDARPDAALAPSPSPSGEDGGEDQRAGGEETKTG